MTDNALKSCAKLHALTLFEIGPDTPPISGQKSKPRRCVIVSRVFPKLALDVKAMLKLDGAKVLATLRRHLGK